MGCWVHKKSQWFLFFLLSLPVFTFSIEFPLDKNGISVSGPRVFYKLSDERLKINDFNINLSRFEGAVERVSIRNYKGGYSYYYILALDWDRVFKKDKDIRVTLEDNKGQYFFSIVIPDQVKKWRKRKIFSSSRLVGDDFYLKVKSANTKPLFFQYRVGLLLPDKKNLKRRIKKSKVCFVQEQGRGELKVCLRMKDNKLVADEKWFRVYRNNKRLKKSNEGIVGLKTSSPYKIRFQFKKGSYVTLSSQTDDLEILEVSRLKNGKIKLVSSCLCPDKRSKLDPLSFVEKWEKKLNLDDTINPRKQTFTAKIPFRAPYRVYANKRVLAMSYYYEIMPSSRGIPREELRPVTLKEPLKSTYSSETRLQLSTSIHKDYLADKNGVLQIQKNTVETEPLRKIASEKHSRLQDEEIVYNWKVAQLQKGVQNQRDINVDGFKLSHQVYRGYSTDLGLRLLTALDGNGGTLGMSEFFATHWFEDLLGWRNKTWSLLRWGMSLRHLSTLNGIPANDGKEYSFSASELNMRYRFSPGVRGKDETWGSLLGFQSVTFDTHRQSLMGAGLFWNRSMPKLLDRTLNFIPFLDYPKWLELEAIYFPFAQGLGGANYSVNFTGKVFWKKQLYGELGFGVKSFDLDFGDNFFQSSLFYGTVGVAYQF